MRAEQRKSRITHTVAISMLLAAAGFVFPCLRYARASSSDGCDPAMASGRHPAAIVLAQGAAESDRERDLERPNRGQRDLEMGDSDRRQEELEQGDRRQRELDTPGADDDDDDGDDRGN